MCRCFRCLGNCGLGHVAYSAARVAVVSFGGDVQVISSDGVVDAS